MRSKIVAFLSNRIVRNLAFMFTAWLAIYYYIESDILDDLGYGYKTDLHASAFWFLVSVFINPFYDLWQKK